MNEDTNDQPSSSGLLDNVNVNDDSKPSDTQSAGIDHRAEQDPNAIAKSTGAPIQRPEYLPENFWNAEKGEADLEAMSKSWSDLRKMISQGKHKAPEGGKYDTSKLGVTDIDSADELSKSYVGWAAKWGVSQAAFDELAENVMGMAQANAEPPIDPAVELKQLGPNGNAIVNGMVDWARGLVAKGVWSKDDFEEFKVMGGTARGINALLKVREAYEGRVPIESQQLDGAPSKEELYAMVGDPKYHSDPAYRQKVARLFEQYT